MASSAEEDSREIRFPRGERHKVGVTCRECGCFALVYPWHVMCARCESTHGCDYMVSRLGSQGRRGGVNRARAHG